MSKLRLLAFSALFAACALALLAPGVGAWIRTIEGPGRAHAVAIDAADPGLGAIHHFYVAKFSSDGPLAWGKAVLSSGTGGDRASSVPPASRSFNFV